MVLHSWGGDRSSRRIRARCTCDAGSVHHRANSIDASASDVVTAIRAAFKGEAVCTPKLCAALFESFAQTAREGSSPCSAAPGGPDAAAAATGKSGSERADQERNRDAAEPVGVYCVQSHPSHPGGVDHGAMQSECCTACPIRVQ